MKDSIQNQVKNSPTFKVLAVLIITLILLIPAYKIESLISERQNLQTDVTNEISSKWGEKQTLSGPIVTVPYIEIENEGTTYEKRSTKHIFILPEELNIDGEVLPNIKKRSIYKAFLYNSNISISGSFDFDKIKDLGISADQLQWSKSTISYGISDPRGISDIGRISWDNKALETEPGLPAAMPNKNGIQSKLNIDEIPEKTVQFTSVLSLKGSSKIDFIPLGKTTRVALNSSWVDPGFGGAFLPEESNIDKDGFTAKWQILDYNRSYGQVWNNYFPALDEWKFGVNLIDPVDVYQKTTRAVKYGFMIIALTFTFFFFFEILKKLKIHPIQYTIVGFAILIFYVLLIALSEQMAFQWAFLLSAMSIVGIVGYYFYFISHSFKITILFTLMFAFIYGFIYVILNAEAYSLLIGSLGLLSLISLIIHFTRNINWYESSEDAGLEPAVSLE
ncbi:cell envelope integrity protein CreD [Cryomorpha ignava]|uniref:Cell envelope integrity protein CreD n=1 Tax=Cryomorpha ignava TaxID=101383 RepID=A0A7K3WVB8_9FLAO|nr:cell envelope integrity protein CreD [Cryomorpha ignava]NEN24991.1 cell envelope integrity protein CreD [Cryomorpha ignava]